MSVFKQNGDNVFIPGEDDEEDLSNLGNVIYDTSATNAEDMKDVSYIPPKNNQLSDCTKMDVEIPNHPFELSKINQYTYNVMNEFNNQVDCTRAYSFKELSEVLKQIISTKTETKKLNDTKKMKTSSYNNYIKIRVNALKIEDPKRPPKDIMAVARSEWNNFTQDQKDTYK